MDELGGGEDVGHVQRALPGLRAARRAEALHIVERLETGGERGGIAGGARVVEQQHRVVRAVAAGGVLEMAALIFAVVAEGAVGLLGGDDAADLCGLGLEPLLRAAGDEVERLVGDVR
ncbi:MAG: hypothetical protein NTY53_05130, partial [Kiritimatiellaeota bacterium]|nr:hypothetical protein [Kiritimatiellota bacterium]